MCPPCRVTRARDERRLWRAFTLFNSRGTEDLGYCREQLLGIIAIDDIVGALSGITPGSRFGNNGEERLVGMSLLQ